MCNLFQIFRIAARPERPSISGKSSCRELLRHANKDCRP